MIILPSPPNATEKYLYVEGRRWLFYIFASLSTVLLSSGSYVFTWANPELWLYGILVTFVFFYLLVSYLVGLKGKPFDYSRHQAIRSKWINHMVFPTVDVYLPVCGEPYEVLENTWKYVAGLFWPEDKLNVHVLDDKPNEANRSLAMAHGFNYIVRKDAPTLKKAGNVRNAFKETSGEFILILDADFCPRSEFLHETVPYMLHDEKIAIVQTPQFFEVKKEQTWIERGAGYIQELFYRLIQVSRNTWGASICVGSCALYRRKALEPMGGTYPIEHSEDLHTGFSMLQQGFKLEYIPIALSKGVCPDSLAAFWTQQYRWCTGSTSLATNPMFWKQKLSIMARLSYLSGMGYYVATAMGIWLSIIPSLYMVWFAPDKLVWFAIAFYGPSFLFGTLFTKLWTRANGSIWNAMRVRQLSYYSHFAALTDRIFKCTMPWVPTGAASQSEKFKRSRYLMWAWSSLSFTLIMFGAGYNMDGWLDVNFYPTIFFSGFNYWLTSSILRDQ